jgi:hypothetical protein
MQMGVRGGACLGGACIRCCRRHCDVRDEADLREVVTLGVNIVGVDIQCGNPNTIVANV